MFCTCIIQAKLRVWAKKGVRVIKWTPWELGNVLAHERSANSWGIPAKEISYLNEVPRKVWYFSQYCVGQCIRLRTEGWVYGVPWEFGHASFSDHVPDFARFVAIFCQNSNITESSALRSPNKPSLASCWDARKGKRTATVNHTRDNRRMKP